MTAITEPTSVRASVGVGLTVDAVSKTYQRRSHRGELQEVAALDSVHIDVPPGSFVSLLGPSGCGKSTLFSIIAGLEPPTTGQVLIDGQDCTGEQGLVGYMLQKDLLLPWRTVLGNVVLALEVRGVRRREAAQLARPLLDQYGLGDFIDSYPAQLSGGMRQRVALLRTLLFHRPVILLDEPFGALDAQTREQMQSWLLDIHADFTKTVVFVTHDIDEAVYLSDTIYVLSGRPGRVIAELSVPLGRPRQPSDITSAEFIAVKEQARSLLVGATATHGERSQP
jgi:ABC-type nitrate/sulfonate/bicarbonate transport system ATPase subunit